MEKNQEIRNIQKHKTKKDFVGTGKRITAFLMTVCLIMISCPMPVYAEQGSAVGGINGEAINNINTSTEGADKNIPTEQEGSGDSEKQQTQPTEGGNTDETEPMDWEEEEASEEKGSEENNSGEEASGGEAPGEGALEEEVPEEEIPEEVLEEAEELEAEELETEELGSKQEEIIPDLPENAAEFAYDEEKGEYFAEITGVSGIGVQVSYGDGVFPNQAVLVAYEITDDAVIETIETALDGGAASYSFDISVLAPVDGAWESVLPDQSVGYPTVTFTGSRIAAAISDDRQYIQVYHVADSEAEIRRDGISADPEEMPVNIPMEEGGAITFAAPHFSTYTILLSDMVMTLAGDTSEAAVTLDGVFTGNNTATQFIIGDTYNQTVNIKTAELIEPNLTITIPKHITLTYYPDASNTTINPYLRNGAASVTVEEDQDGNTVLRYEFKNDTTELGFNITLQPTMKLKNNTQYSVKAQLSAADAAAAEDAFAVTMSNPSVARNAVIIKDAQTTYTYSLDGSTYYDKALPQCLYLTYAPHYSYDSLTAVIPVYEGVAAGYYDENNNFCEIKDKGSRTITIDGINCGKVSYYSKWSGYDGSVAHTMPVLVYELNDKHPACAGSTGAKPYYCYGANMGGIYFRFTEAHILEQMGEADTWTAKATGSGQVLIRVDGAEVTAQNTNTTFNYGKIIFKQIKLDDNFYISGSISVDKISPNFPSHILNIEDAYYYRGYIVNKTEEVLTDVVVEYKFDTRLYANRIKAKLNTTGTLPAQAVVEYKTKKNPEKIVTQTLTAADPELTLTDKEDAISWMQVTYDRVAHTTSNIQPLTVYMANRDDTEASEVAITAQILSARASTELAGESGIIGAKEVLTTKCNLIKKIDMTPGGTLKISSGAAALSKGDTFTYTFISHGRKLYVDNPVYYILMPEAYVFSGYTQPADYKGLAYTLSTRAITVSAEASAAIGTAYVPAGDYTLYTLSYRGQELSSNASHIMKFTVGTGVDTSTYQPQVYLPALFMTEHENPLFPYSSAATYNQKDILDFDQDGDVAETMAKPNTRTSAPINMTQALSIQAYLTSDYSGAEENISQYYQYNSKGSYNYYMYNGLDSGSVNAADIIIALPRDDVAVSYSGDTYTSTWNGLLTGAPVFKGSFLDGAVTAYSADGGSSYSYNPTEAGNSYAKVTHIKITSATGSRLEQGKSVRISVPIAADFAEDTFSAANEAYLGTVTTYTLSGTGVSGSAESAPCTLIPAAVPANGVVFKDHNGNNTQDDTEKDNGKYYPVVLYRGQYTSGTTGLTSLVSGSSNKTTGIWSVTNYVFNSGYYTIRVEKAAAEYFPVLSDWKVEGNYAYHTVRLGGDDSSIDWSLPIISTRTLEVSGFANNGYLYEGNAVNLSTAVNPVLGDDEAVTFESADPKVVTVDKDGKLNWVGEGDAIITISVPQNPAYIDRFGDEPITKSLTVRARKPGYKVTLYTGDVTLTSDVFLQTEKGVYTGTFVPGTALALPAESALSGTVATGYRLGGWYEDETYAGAVKTQIVATDYGDKVYYGGAVPQETQYERTADNWVYGSFKEAAASVYNGGRIKLLRDITISSTMSFNKKVTIMTDGADRLLDCGNNRLQVHTNGALTIDDSHLTITGENSNGVLYGYSSTANITQITIKKGTITNEGAGSAINIITGRTAIISGGTLSGGTYAISTSGTLKLSGQPVLSGVTADIYLPQQSTYTGQLDVTDGLAEDTSYSVKTHSATAGLAISSACDTNYSGHFSSVEEGHRIGYGSDKKLYLQKGITVTPTADQSKAYGGDDPQYGYSLSEDVSVSGALGREEGENAGSYDYTLGNLSVGNGYYLILDDENQFTIQAAAVTLPVVSNQNYDGTTKAHGLTDTTEYTVSIASGDTASAVRSGIYTVTLTLTDTTNYKWPDNTTAPKQISWKITKTDTAAPTIEDITETVNSETGVMTVRVTLKDDSSEVDTESIVLKLGESEVAYTVTETADGWVVTFTRTDGADYVLEVGDTDGNQESYDVATAVTLYTVSFSGGTDGAGTGPASQKHWQYKQISLPNNTFTREGYVFRGWKLAGALYQAADSYTMLAGDVTFIAQWRLAGDNPGIDGEAVYENEKPAAGGAITLSVGDTAIDTVVVAADGSFAFDDVPDGEYTITVAIDDSKSGDQSKETAVRIVDGRILIGSEAGDDNAIVLPKPDVVTELEKKITAILPDLTGKEIAAILEGNNQEAKMELGDRIKTAAAEIEAAIAEFQELSGIKKEQFDEDIVEKLEALAPDADITAPYLEDITETVNQETGKVTVEVTVKDDASGLVKGSIVLKVGEAAATYLLTETADGWVITFTREEIQDYTLVISDTEGNQGSYRLESELPLYTVNFVGGTDGAGTGPESKEHWQYRQINLPDNTFTRKDYTFSGWQWSGKLYQSGALFTMPAQEVTFNAKWAYAGDGASIGGEVLYENGRPAVGADVFLSNDRETIGTTVTDKDGSFIFPNIPDGNQTIKIKISDSQSGNQTTEVSVSIVDGRMIIGEDNQDEIMIVIQKPNVVKKLENKIEGIQPGLTGAEIQNVLNGDSQEAIEELKKKIKADDEEIRKVLAEYEQISDIKKEQMNRETLEKLEGLVLVSGSVEFIFDNQGRGVQMVNSELLLGLLVTAQDLEQQAGQGVDIKVVVEIAEVQDAASDEGISETMAAMQSYAGNRQVGAFHEITIKKIVGNTTTVISQIAAALDITFEIPEFMRGGSNYGILRDHQGQITELPTTRNGNMLTAASDLFSTYAIIYTPLQRNNGGKGSDSGAGSGSGGGDVNQNETQIVPVGTGAIPDDEAQSGRKLDAVPKTGHGGGTVEYQMKPVIMWIDKKDRNKCRKKESQD